MLLRSSRVPFSLPELEFLPTTRAYLSRTREIMKDSDLYRDGRKRPEGLIAEEFRVPVENVQGGP